MKSIIASLFIIFNTYGLTLQHNVPQNGEDHGPDLPTIGSSYFDKIFSQVDDRGVSKYDVPYPFERLLEKFDGDRAQFTHTLLPFSRSLQRPLGQAYDPLKNPRLVITPFETRYDISKSKIYLGYVRATDQIEVISYNDEAGRYEYQIVTDFSKNPKVNYVPRGKCLSCHQGQTPIFSTPNWSDTSFGSMSNLIAASLNIGVNNHITRLIRIKENLYGPIPSTDNAADFDFKVRVSDRIATEERVWNVGCGENNSCRLGLLLKTLSPDHPLTKKFFTISKEVIKSSKLVGQNFYHSFIASTDLGARGIIRKYKDIGDGDKYENTANNPKAVGEIINNIYTLPRHQNPTTSRITGISPGSLVPSSLMTFNQKDISVLRKEKINVGFILIELFNSNDEIFNKTSINKPLVMTKILLKAKSSHSTYYSKWVNRLTPKKNLYTGTVMPVFKKHILNTFSRHCFKCHATTLRYPPQFLIGSEQEVERNIKGLKEKIIYKLENNLMPPTTSARDILISSGDKESILNYIKNL